MIIQKKEPSLFAAVDLGSNSFQMTVARRDGGRLRPVDTLKETIRLAAGVRPDQTLDAGTVERALDCLHRFRQRLEPVPAPHIRAVGTNALRQARCADQFVKDAEAALGCPIEIISGGEEARLIYAGVYSCHPLPDRARLVIDIGGGSTELALGRGDRPELTASLPVGCVETSRDHFPGGALSADRFATTIMAIRQTLAPTGHDFRRRGWDIAIGSSGITRVIADNLPPADEARRLIRPSLLYRLRDRLIEAGRVEAAALPALPPDRAAILPGGLAILIAAFETLAIESMQTSECALREGVLHELAGHTIVSGNPEPD